MVMLRKRKLILALINKIPMIYGRQLGRNGSTDRMITELQNLYGSLARYDALINHIGKVGI